MEKNIKNCLTDRVVATRRQVTIHRLVNVADDAVRYSHDCVNPGLERCFRRSGLISKTLTTAAVV